MAKKFKTLRDKMGLERKKRIKLMADQAIQEMVISEIRKFVGMSQVEAAENFGTSQPH